jgi:hypothetical protein
MSHRGTKAKHEAEWRNYQRRLGYKHGRIGHPQQFGDQHYLRGYREGANR